MAVHLKRRDEPCLQRTAPLTPDDIAALLPVCSNTRDRAFLSIPWESGSRISELGKLQLKHEHGYILDLEGKTGRCSPLSRQSSFVLSR